MENDKHATEGVKCVELEADVEEGSAKGPAAEVIVEVQRRWQSRPK